MVVALQGLRPGIGIVINHRIKQFHIRAVFPCHAIRALDGSDVYALNQQAIDVIGADSIHAGIKSTCLSRPILYREIADVDVDRGRTGRAKNTDDLTRV